MSLLKMSRRRLALRNARARVVGRRRHGQDRHVATWGLVDTGSEWDGVHINIVWRQIRQNCASDEAAYELTKAIWENRAHALRERRRNGRDRLDEALVEVPAWEMEPELNYFPDEEQNHER